MENDADLVLVFGGTNDYGHGNAPFGTMDDRTPATFCGACHLLFHGLVEKYPLSKIVIMTPMQREGGSQPSAFRPEGRLLLDYVNAIIEIAGVYSLPVLVFTVRQVFVRILQCRRKLFALMGCIPMMPEQRA